MFQSVTCSGQTDDPHDHALCLYSFLICVISLARFYMEAAAGEIPGKIHFHNTFLKAYFKELATAISQAGSNSPDEFRGLSDVFFFGGVPLKPLGRPWAHCIAPGRLFLCILGAPGHHFGQLRASWRSPGCLSGHDFDPRHHQEREKLTPCGNQLNVVKWF